MTDEPETGVRGSRVEAAARELLSALVPDWQNDSDLIDTPRRLARMYVNELCAGLFTPLPDLTAFPKPRGMDQPMTVGPITVHGLCPHHLAPILGNAWVGILPGSTLLGLSKYARLVRWCMARPIMQEQATELIAAELARALPDALGVAVVVRVEHLCMRWRGVREPAALTTTSAVWGVFRTDAAVRGDFMRFVGWSQ